MSGGGGGEEWRERKRVRSKKTEQEREREEGASSPLYSESGTTGCCQVTVGRGLEEMLRDRVFFCRLGRPGTHSPASASLRTRIRACLTGFLSLTALLTVTVVCIH